MNNVQSAGYYLAKWWKFQFCRNLWRFSISLHITKRQKWDVIGYHTFAPKKRHDMTLPSLSLSLSLLHFLYWLCDLVLAVSTEQLLSLVSIGAVISDIKSLQHHILYKQHLFLLIRDLFINSLVWDCLFACAVFCSSGFRVAIPELDVWFEKKVVALCLRLLGYVCVYRIRAFRGQDSWLTRADDEPQHEFWIRIPQNQSKALTLCQVDLIYLNIILHTLIELQNSVFFWKLS